MKKKLLIGLVVVVVIAFAGYKYVYRDHRDITSEDAAFTTTVAQLNSEFSADNTGAIKKYADKTIEVSGIITSFDSSEHTLMIDEKLSASLKDSTSLNVLIGKQATVKGRFVGYDDLLEEYKMDQVSIQN